MPPANSRKAAEIQPLQDVTAPVQPAKGRFSSPESVDGATDPLYKGANWRRAQSCRRCSLSSCRLF